MSNKNQAPALPSPWPNRFERLGIAILGIILFCLPLFFWIRTQDQFELPKLTLLRILSSGLIGCWVASQALQPTWRWRRTPLDLPLLLWSAWLIVKTFNSVSPWISWRGEYENFDGSLTQLNYSLLFWASVQLVQDSTKARKLLYCFELSCVAVGMYAIFQALGLDFIVWSASSVVATRYFASMGNPNFLGALMIMSLVLILARAMQREELPSPRSLRWQWAFLALLPLVWFCFYLFFPSAVPHTFDLDTVFHQGQKGAIGVIGIYGLLLITLGILIKLGKARLSQDLAYCLEGLVLFKSLADTGTRGAFAGLLAALGLFAVLAMARQWHRMTLGGTSITRRTLIAGGTLVALFVALTAASFAMGPELRLRMIATLRHPLNAFDSSRENIWVPGWNIAKDHPWTGTGVDTFKTVFPQYSYSRFALFDGDNVSSRTAHCEPLQILATMGTIGLALWFWLIGAWSLAWWRRYRVVEKSEEAWIVGLGALVLGYLVQNLVSFGVSAITAPFFLCMGLLWAGQDIPQWRRRIRLPHWITISLCGLGVILGIFLSCTTFYADELYSFGHMVDTQMQVLANGSYDDCRNASFYALDALGPYRSKMRDEQSKEMDYWLQGLKQQESTPKETEADEKAAQPFYSQSSQALLLLLSTLKQEESVRLCPGEVKYGIYLGLAYEDLYKISKIPDLRETWFKLAESVYTKGIAMNPRNAYYHGNLGRLYSLKAEEGQGTFVAASEKEYLEAVSLAPSTKLFYENLILLYSQNGMAQSGLDLLAPLETREPEMAAELYMALGTTLYQWEWHFQDDLARRHAITAVALESLSKAEALDPSNPDVPYVIGAIYFDMKNKKMAKVYMLKSLAVKPAYPLATQFIRSNKL